MNIALRDTCLWLKTKGGTDWAWLPTRCCNREGEIWLHIRSVPSPVLSHAGSGPFVKGSCLLEHIGCPNLKALTLKAPFIYRQQAAEQRTLTFASSEVYRDSMTWPRWTAARRKDSNTEKFATSNRGSRRAGSVALLCELIALWHVGSSQSKDWSCAPHTGRWTPNLWTTKEAPLVGLWFASFLFTKTRLFPPNQRLCFHSHRPAQSHLPRSHLKETGRFSASLFSVW